MEKEKIGLRYDAGFLKMYDYEYKKDQHYYWTSRRKKDDLIAAVPDADHRNIQADAVSCFVILNIKDQPLRLLLNWEFRYPAGQYIMSVPAGIIDKEDKANERTLEITAARELYEETGILLTEEDEITVVNPCVYSTPGLTDETNALVYISINRDEMPELNHGHAEGSEKFEGFCLVTKEEAQEYLSTGRDKRGMFYPLYTWAALMFFMGTTK